MNQASALRGTSAFYSAVFLNTFVDLGHKIVMQHMVFKLYTGATLLVLNTLISAMLLLPFILLLTPAGYLTDRYPKLQVLRGCTWVLLAACLLLALCYQRGWFEAAFALSLVLTMQAALFSPAKYAFIKEFFGTRRLGEVNGTVAALLVAAALAGVGVYTAVFAQLYSVTATTPAALLRALAPGGWLLVLGALLALVSIYRVPLPASQSLPLARFSWQACLSPRHWPTDLQPLLAGRAIGRSVLTLALFWALVPLLLSALPAYLQHDLGIQSPLLLQGIVACLGIGLGFGAVYAGRFSRNYIDTGLLPLGAFGVALGLALLPSVHNPWVAAVLLLLIGSMGGLVIVPLNALIQYSAAGAQAGRVLAASNWLQRIGMLLCLLLVLVFATLGWRSRTLLQLGAAVAVVAAFYTVLAQPQSLTRLLLSRVAATRYRIKVQGMKHIPAQGGVLLLGNHVSWIDWAIVQIASPRPVRFVMNSSTYELWYLRWFFQRCGCIAITAGAPSRQSLENVAAALNRGEVVCLFPEGVISGNGHLAEFSSDFETACAEVDDSVIIVPFYLRGLWGNVFTGPADRVRRRLRYQLNREVVVDFGAPLPPRTTAEVLKRKVMELANFSWREYADKLPAIGAHWIDTCKRRHNPVVLSDTLGVSLRSRSALTGSLVLARRMRRCSPEQNVGVLLPSSIACALTNMALLMLGKTVVNLNFTAPYDALVSAVLQAEVKTIYTSERFLARLASRGVDLQALSEHCQLVLLEQFRATTSTLERVLTLATCWLLPASWLKALYCRRVEPMHPAVILFSSGSEGHPKGVVLTHRNLLCNVKQFTELLNPDDDDVMLANLPPFHAFGLTVTQLMPLLERVPVVCHADPLDVYGAAIAIAEHRITLLFGTSSFFRLYLCNSKIHPLMLTSLRLVVAGAEKLQDEVRREFKLKFNHDLLEGYGATETAPVASVNMPDMINTDNWQVQVGNKIGSVGLPLPGTSFRIVDPDSYTPLPTGTAGMILISGAQVMQGYLKNTQQSQAALIDLDGMTWYVTGDKGYLDSDGFLFIQDRYSRFAKIGGEMVGLGSVESALKQVLADPGFDVVVVSLPDMKKGEKLIVLSNRNLDATSLREALLAHGLGPLALPAHYFTVPAIPRLGSGKLDFAGSRTLARDLIASQC